ncbi:N-acetylmuramoyl-L-alanine amidase [Desulfoscipio geothermicus]|uniref:N-acetylmuramoyl-L-alanine amidase n=1 Tax=Desulfoscipio geothermicus DSM 3669 TaxID=1121426 RepID=A0A1I6EGH8_9FIRM|nr:N-acetylmuramoyl-L-alanine amidase [Desulfoscipio geothermicus]SFR16834.1 N-acetylmuramoyl-L-alanine amidase [Desulfoscipio geothermicus DSM 3669]
MQITETNLQFKELHPRKATQRIIIHHSASQGDEDAATIHRWHLDRGWSGCGYHFIVRKSGEIQRGRPERMVGAHAGRQGNWNSIGICVVGNFNIERPTKEQLDSLVWLIGHLEDKYGQLKVIGHRDVMATDCPGNLFPWEQLRAMVRGSAQPAQDDVRLTINGRPTQVPLRVANGRTEALLSGHWVQLRDLAGLLQAEIGWDADTRTVNFIIK